MGSTSHAKIYIKSHRKMFKLKFLFWEIFFVRVNLNNNILKVNQKKKKIVSVVHYELWQNDDDNVVLLDVLVHSETVLTL